MPYQPLTMIKVQCPGHKQYTETSGEIARSKQFADIPGSGDVSMILYQEGKGYTTAKEYEGEFIQDKSFFTDLNLAIRDFGDRLADIVKMVEERKR